MRLARITGRVSASIKTGKLTGVRMLVADYVDAGGEVLEPAVVVTDACGAGPGDLVLVANGSAARVPAEMAGLPGRAAVWPSPLSDIRAGSADPTASLNVMDRMPLPV